MAPRRVRSSPRGRDSSGDTGGANWDRLGEFLERQAAQNVQGGLGAEHDRFMRQHPPSFDGRSAPEVAEDWIFRMEKIFRAIGVAPERRVDLATYVFDGEAANWWRTASTVVFEDREDVSWDEFLEVFHEQYFPQHVRDWKREEFMSLEQKEMTLASYISRFNALERYCPEICVTPEQRARKFVKGLR